MNLRMDLLRQLKPRSTFDLLSIVYALFLIHIVPLHCVFVITPWKQREFAMTSCSTILVCIILVFFYVNIIGSMWKIMTVNTSTTGKVLPTIAPEDWHYCESCQANSPPRSFHCRTCDLCILRRDHHCMFTGKCVGYYTYKHYIYLLGYCWIEALFAAAFCHTYTWTLLEYFSIGNLFCAVFPMVCFTFGVLDFYTTYCVLMSTLTTGFSVLLTGLVIYHSKHVYFGLTTYERRHDINKYSLGLKRNLQEIFGERWKVAWILPFIPSALPGDGLKFDTALTFEDRKNQ